MKKILGLLLVSLFLVSCVKDAEHSQQRGNYNVEFLFQHDNCKVYRFYDSRYIYYTDCGCGSSTITTHREGKTDVLDVVESK